MLIPTIIFVALLIVFIMCVQLELSDCTRDETKLNNIQKLNVCLVIVVLCYICFFAGKVFL